MKIETKKYGEWVSDKPIPENVKEGLEAGMNDRFKLVGELIYKGVAVKDVIEKLPLDK